MSSQPIPDVSPIEGYGLIYLYTLDNGEKYIGQTSHPLKIRHYGHINGKEQLIDRKLKKHSFTLEVLDEVPVEQLDDKEQHYIQKMNTLHPNGLNMVAWGTVNRIISEETRKRMSESIRKNISGQKFGRLTALEYEGDSYWKCRCDCGKETSIAAYNLTTGLSKSCGCLRRDISSARMHDLRGQRFGHVIALEPTGRRTGHNTVWKCECDCGNICEIAYSNLYRHDHVSCGCVALKIKHSIKKNLVGMKFNDLTVIEFAYKKGHNSFWKCRCDCGNECIVRSDHLQSGATSTCGCLLRRK